MKVRTTVNIPGIARPVAPLRRTNRHVHPVFGDRSDKQVYNDAKEGAYVTGPLDYRAGRIGPCVPGG